MKQVNFQALVQFNLSRVYDEKEWEKVKMICRMYEGKNDLEDEEVEEAFQKMLADNILNKLNDDQIGTWESVIQLVDRRMNVDEVVIAKGEM